MTENEQKKFVGKYYLGEHWKKMDEMKSKNLKPWLVGSDTKLKHIVVQNSDELATDHKNLLNILRILFFS